VKTDNIYESIVIVSKRANQISNNIKGELHQNYRSLLHRNDNLEEVLKTASKLKFLNTTKGCQNIVSSYPGVFRKIRFTTVTLLKSNNNNPLSFWTSVLKYEAALFKQSGFVLWPHNKPSPKESNSPSVDRFHQTFRWNVKNTVHNATNQSFLTERFLFFIRRMFWWVVER